MQRLGDQHEDGEGQERFVEDPMRPHHPGRQSIEGRKAVPIATDDLAAIAAEMDGDGQDGETELLAKAAAVDETDPWRRTEAAFVALIDACAAPETQRIIFLAALAEASRAVAEDRAVRNEAVDLLRRVLGALRL